MEDLTQFLPNAIGGAAGQSPAVILMLFLLREIRSWKQATLEQAKSDATDSARVTVAEARLADLQARVDAEAKETRDRLALIESQQNAVWRKIGDRASDREPG